MADETKQPEEQAARPETDWKAEFDRAQAELEELRKQSRKWEDRSKSNAEKARAYDKLAAQSMTDAERIEAAETRATEAEKRLADYEREAQRAKDAAEVSEQFGVPASLITEADRKAMELQAQAIRAYAEGRPASQVFGSDGKRPGEAKPDPKQQFSEWFQEISR